MREILFRGKRFDGEHEWVEGIAFPHDGDKVTMFRQHPMDGSLEGNEVIPETVGQYTGLTDKNGTKIFEKDIVRCKNYHGTVEGYIGYSESGVYFLLCFSGYSDEYLFNCTDIEVIGNIHDNPELLGGENNG